MSGKCVFCGAEIVYRCRCLRGDRRCANGHEYHFCTTHPAMAVSGPGDHGKQGCSCFTSQAFYAPRLKPVKKATP